MVHTRSGRDIGSKSDTLEYSFKSKATKSNKVVKDKPPSKEKLKAMGRTAQQLSQASHAQMQQADAEKSRMRKWCKENGGTEADYKRMRQERFQKNLARMRTSK